MFTIEFNALLSFFKQTVQFLNFKVGRYRILEDFSINSINIYKNVIKHKTLININIVLSTI